MPTAHDLIEALTAEYANERAIIDSLPLESRMRHGTPEAWSALDLQGHITAWKHQTVLRLREDPSAVEEVSEDETDQANAVFFETFANRSWQDVFDESESTHQALVDELGKLNEGDLAQSDRYAWQDGLPLWRRLAGTLLVHPWMHLAEHAIEKADHETAMDEANQMAVVGRLLGDDPHWTGALDYNAACIFARAGKLDGAFGLLEAALAQRKDLIEWSKQDPDLVSLRADPRMGKIYAALDS